MQGQSRYWFRAKKLGWGWVPASSEGWAITLGYVAAAWLGSVVLIQDDRSFYDITKYLAFVFVLTAGLLYVCWKTGEDPRRPEDSGR